MKILIVEDDIPIATVVKRGLERARYQVDLAHDGREGLALALNPDYSLILLDIMLPELDGLTVCRRVRARGLSTPIFMLTARDALQDRVDGLDIGADDYLIKPFEFPELLARVRALLRRDYVHKGAVVRIADLELDRDQHRVTRGGQEISLTPREFALLEALAVQEGRVLTRDYIRDQVWNDDDSYSNNVETFIKQLRRKIDSEPFPKLIHTVHGLGYSLRNPAGDDA